MTPKLPATVGATELAGLLQVGPRHLRRLAEVGVAVRAEGGGYELGASVRAYLAHAGAAARRSRGSSAATELREARAEAIKRRLDRQEAGLVDTGEIADCLRVVAALADEAMTAILAAHDEEARAGLAPHIEEAREKIAKGRDQALQTLIDGRPRS